MHEEIGMLQRLDRQRFRILFTGIASPGFRIDGLGPTQSVLMESSDGRLPDGTMLQGVKVFPRLYGAVGIKRPVPLTRLPGVSHALDLGYCVFAKNQLAPTERCVDDGCELPDATSRPREASLDGPAC